MITDSEISYPFDPDNKKKKREKEKKREKKMLQSHNCITLLVIKRDKNIILIIVHAFTVKAYAYKAHWWERSNDEYLKDLYKCTLRCISLSVV